MIALLVSVVELLLESVSVSVDELDRSVSVSQLVLEAVAVAASVAEPVTLLPVSVVNFAAESRAVEVESIALPKSSQHR